MGIKRNYIEEKGTDRKESLGVDAFFGYEQASNQNGFGSWVWILVREGDI